MIKIESILETASTIIPIVYIWSTPYLASKGICLKGRSPTLGHSLSRFISTPQATGMMAFFFFGLSNLMISKRFLKAFQQNKSNKNDQSFDGFMLLHNKNQIQKKIFIISGYIYEINFGLFLCFPTIWMPQIHGTVVCIFVFSAYIHMALLQMSPNIKHFYKIQLLFLNILGTFSILGLIITKILIFYEQKIPIYLFWSLECAGLSCLLLFMDIGQMAISSIQNKVIVEPLQHF